MLGLGLGARSVHERATFWLLASSNDHGVPVSLSSSWESAGHNTSVRTWLLRRVFEQEAQKTGAGRFLRGPRAKTAAMRIPRLFLRVSKAPETWVQQAWRGGWGNFEARATMSASEVLAAVMALTGSLNWPGIPYAPPAVQYHVASH